MPVRITLIILSIAAFLGSVIWLYKSPDWEPAVAVIVAAISLIALLYSGKTDKDKPTMTQESGDGSTNYQSGQDININIKK